MKSTRSQENKKLHTRFRIAAWAYTAVIVVLVLVLFYTVFFSFAVVSNDGMQPTLKSGDVIMHSRIAKYVNGIRRSDVVIFKDNSGSNVLGRVIAESGESVQIQNNKTYINGILLDERSYASGNINDVPKTIVPLGCVFILPDNRSDTASLELTIIKADNISGIAAFRLFPLNRIGVFA